MGVVCYYSATWPILSAVIFLNAAVPNESELMRFNAITLWCTAYSPIKTRPPILRDNFTFSKHSTFSHCFQNLSNCLMRSTCSILQESLSSPLSVIWNVHVLITTYNLSAQLGGLGLSATNVPALETLNQITLWWLNGKNFLQTGCRSLALLTKCPDGRSSFSLGWCSSWGKWIPHTLASGAFSHSRKQWFCSWWRTSTFWCHNSYDYSQ